MSVKTDDTEESAETPGTNISITRDDESLKSVLRERRVDRLMRQLPVIAGVELKPMVGRELQDSQLEEQLQIELPVTVRNERAQEGYYPLDRGQDEEGFYYSIPDGYGTRLKNGDDTVFAGISVTIDPEVASAVAIVPTGDDWNPKRAYRLDDSYRLNLRIDTAPVFLIASTHGHTPEGQVSARVFALRLRFTPESAVMLPEVTEIPLAKFREPLGYRMQYHGSLPKAARNAIRTELTKIGVS